MNFTKISLEVNKKIFCSGRKLQLQIITIIIEHQNSKLIL